MGGKGRKRREKNYRAAHGGGYTRLPPPPDPSQVDALPSKLRKLISFTSSLSQGGCLFFSFLDFEERNFKILVLLLNGVKKF